MAQLLSSGLVARSLAVFVHPASILRRPDSAGRDYRVTGTLEEPPLNGANFVVTAPKTATKTDTCVPDAAEWPVSPFRAPWGTPKLSVPGVDRPRNGRAEVGDGRVAQVVALGPVGVDGVLDAARRGVDEALTTSVWQRACVLWSSWWA